MTSDKDFVKFEENPYNPESKGPEEIVRLFYSNNVPILPVVSKRGLLLGILTKEGVISELSDIERVGKQKIDAFIMKISKKMSLDELLPIAGNIKEYVVINLFGEIYGKWSRLELFAACEKTGGGSEKEIVKHREEQVLEWMIYLVLEHIPRALYAVNDKGKTIFYNNYFEDLFSDNVKKDIDTRFIESSLSNTDRNDFYYKGKNNKDIYFFNKDMKFFYEKVPLLSNDKNVGYLFFVDTSLSENPGILLPGIDKSIMPLNTMMESIERSIIVESLLQNGNDIDKAAAKLKIAKKNLANKIDKFSIDLNKIRG